MNQINKIKVLLMIKIVLMPGMAGAMLGTMLMMLGS